MFFRAHRRKVVSGAEGMIGKQGKLVLRERELWVKVEGEFWQLASTKGLSEEQLVIVVAVEGLSLRVKSI